MKGPCPSERYRLLSNWNGTKFSPKSFFHWSNGAVCITSIHFGGGGVVAVRFENGNMFESFVLKHTKVYLYSMVSGPQVSNEE
ncbi:hypothetical protein BLOT_012089 [Blomia tropicalis]|nr:hypothetical protein BLOT_012089 [Blomia tropicalis]